MLLASQFGSQRGQRSRDVARRGPPSARSARTSHIIAFRPVVIVYGILGMRQGMLATEPISPDHLILRWHVLSLGQSRRSRKAHHSCFLGDAFAPVWLAPRMFPYVNPPYTSHTVEGGGACKTGLRRAPACASYAAGLASPPPLDRQQTRASIRTLQRNLQALHAQPTAQRSLGPKPFG